MFTLANTSQFFLLRPGIVIRIRISSLYKGNNHYNLCYRISSIQQTIFALSLYCCTKLYIVLIVVQFLLCDHFMHYVLDLGMFK